MAMCLVWHILSCSDWSHYSVFWGSGNWGSNLWLYICIQCRHSTIGTQSQPLTFENHALLRAAVGEAVSFMSEPSQLSRSKSYVASWCSHSHQWCISEGELTSLIWNLKKFLKHPSMKRILFFLGRKIPRKIHGRLVIGYGLLVKTNL